MIEKLSGASLNLEWFVTAASIAYILLLLVNLIADHRIGNSIEGKDDVATIMMYMPFMVAVPKTAYHYELIVLIVLIPIICYLWERYTLRIPRVTLMVGSLGIVMSQVQAVGITNIFHRAGLATGWLPHLIPGLGLLLVLLSVTFLKLWKVRRSYVAKQASPENPA